jgi:predicted O-methyltransferase YrrM
MTEDLALAEKSKRRQKRRKIKAAMPAVDLDNCHTENCRLLGDRRELLKRMPRNAVAAEIGAAFGDFTEEITKLARPARLHLIDAWEADRYQSGLDAIRQKFPEDIAADRIILTQGLSTDILERFDDDYFDWVYIDTDHSYGTTRQELALSARKVKKDGLIAGHDFCTGNVVKALPYGVIQACAEFCVTFGWQYHYLALDPMGHFSFCLKRI